jgi:hypothetical protein
MKIKLLAALVGLAGCSFPYSIVKPSFLIEDIAIVDSEDLLQGHFDEEGNWVPNNPDIAMTYQIPDISAGLLVDLTNIKEVKVSPGLQIELLEFNTHIPYLGTLKLDIGGAYMRAYGYIGKRWTAVFEISTGIVYGWDFREKEPFYGVCLTLIRF